MGWTSYEATHYKNGKVDRKAEMDKQYTQEEHDSSFDGEIIHYPKMEVLKSSMVGSIYYAAVHITDSQDGYDRTLAVICLTSTKWNGGMNFGYKDMDETCNPGYYDCPKGILDLLSPTDNEYALEWRRLCHEKRTNIIDTVNFTDISTDEETQAAIQKKVTAQQELELAQIQAQTAKVEAEKDKEVAMIAAEKAKIEAESNANVKRIAAEAEAEANKKIAESLTPELIEKIKYEKWDGTLPTVSGSNGTIIDLTE